MVRLPTTPFCGLLYQPRLVETPEKTNDALAMELGEPFFSLTPSYVREVLKESKRTAETLGSWRDSSGQNRFAAMNKKEFTLTSIAMTLDAMIAYDYHRSYPVIRHPIRTIFDGRGMCTEKGLLFNAVLRSIGEDVAFSLGANPAPYQTDGPHDFGIHPLFRIGNTYYAADTGALPKVRGLCTSRTPELSQAQILGVILGQAAEHHGERGNHKEVVKYCLAGLQYDPNNYTLPMMLAGSHASRKEKRKMDMCLTVASSMAPHCGDIDKMWGDMLNFYFDDHDGMLDKYAVALEKGLTDAQLAAQVYLDSRGTSLEDAALEQFATLSRQHDLQSSSMPRIEHWGRKKEYFPLYEAGGWQIPPHNVVKRRRN